VWAVTAPSIALPSAPPGASWPGEVRAEVAARHGAALEAASGRVLDLAEHRDRQVVTDTLAGHPVPAPFDVVVSPGALVMWADLPAAVAAIVSLLAPAVPAEPEAGVERRDAGRLVAIEPLGRPGWRGLVTGTLATVVAGGRPLAGQHLNRDLPPVLRAAGLTICSIERFTMPTPTWILRRFVDVTAMPIGAGER
jgi:hypothetical protein